MADSNSVTLVDGAVILSYDQFREVNPNGLVSPEYNAPMYVRNRMVNVDQLLPELRQYKHITTIYPAAIMHENSKPLQIAWGGFDYVGTDPFMGPYLEFLPNGVNYRLDSISKGRFLDLRILYEDDVYDASISALDMDITGAGKS
ncbi:hypothetical protein ACFZ8E_07465 [Methylobacterium sp. HMF5984]|uniref:hypothetical protein n=1 Tax=Methylobacterium sp. HMF5984 TaxID=3367370 RepID=UPI0038521413